MTIYFSQKRNSPNLGAKPKGCFVLEIGIFFSREACIIGHLGIQRKYGRRLRLNTKQNKK